MKYTWYRHLSIDQYWMSPCSSADQHRNFITCRYKTFPVKKIQAAALSDLPRITIFFININKWESSKNKFFMIKKKKKNPRKKPILTLHFLLAAIYVSTYTLDNVLMNEIYSLIH